MYCCSLHRSGAIQASLEGKTKEKLESMALTLFCLALQYGNPMESWSKPNYHECRESYAALQTALVFVDTAKKCNTWILV